MILELDCRHRHGEFALDVRAAIPLEGVTGLFGPSGGGKTTLLRVIAGLEPAARGRVSCNGEIWQQDVPRVFIPPHQRRIGYVFQESRLFDHLSVEDNLRYGLRRRSGPILYDDVVGILDLSALLTRHPASLSGGEQQRVAIGRALLSQPHLLLLDEPMSALDLPRKREILAYLDRIPVRFQVPIIHVTHAVDEIARLARHVLVLAQGRVIRAGGVAEIFGDTDLGGIAGAAGTGTLLEARVVSRDDDRLHTVVEVEGRPIIIPGTGFAQGSSVRLHIHSRDVSIALKRPEQISIRNILEATVVKLVEAPDSSHVEVQLDFGGRRLRSRVTRAAVEDLGLRPGLAVFALIKGISLDWQLFDEGL